MRETHQQPVETKKLISRAKHLYRCMFVHAFINVCFLNSDYVYGKSTGGLYGAEFVYLDCEDIFKALCGRRLNIFSERSWLKSPVKPQ